jgi:hypothetical protein
MTTDPNQPQPQRQPGKFYFIRAFWTTMGILLSWTLWVLLPAIVLLIFISVFGGIGALIPDNDASPADEPTASVSCYDPDTQTEPRGAGQPYC